MAADNRTLICIEPTATQQAIAHRIADENGLGFVACAGEDAAMRCLDDDRRYAVMVIGHQLADGDSFHVIESARLSLLHATLPVAFIMSDREPRLARNALNAGATEIFLRREHEALAAFVGDWTAVAEKPNLGGRVLLVEDSDAHAQYVASLCAALGMQVDRAEDVDSALALFGANSYQIAIVDVVLNDTRSGISFVRTLRQDHLRHQPILVVSGFDDVPRRLLALKSGADDFIGKPFSPEEFVWRIKKVMQGYAGQDYGDAPPPAPSRAGAAPPLLGTLSPREAEICGKILAGTSDREIAGELGISYWTVRSHIQQIFTKTGALNKRELMARFIPPAANRG